MDIHQQTMPVMGIGFANFFGVNAAVITDTALANQSTANNGFRVPDIVGNLQLDQAWGCVGVSAALHWQRNFYP